MKTKRSALHSPFPLRATRFENDRKSEIPERGAWQNKSNGQMAGKCVAKSACEPRAKAKAKRAKPRRARRSLLFAYSPIQSPGRNSTSACQEIFQALRGLHHPTPHLEDGLLCPLYDRRSPTAMLTWTVRQLFSTTVHICRPDAEHPTNFPHATSAPARSKRFALPTAAYVQALAQKRTPSETLSDLRLLQVRAVFGPLRLSRAKYEYTFRTA